MGILEFMGDHPVLTFFLACIAGSTLTSLVSWPFRIVNRYFRHRNIAAKGWPPAHLDADGDWKPAAEE